MGEEAACGGEDGTKISSIGEEEDRVDEFVIGLDTGLSGDLRKFMLLFPIVSCFWL